MVKRVVLRAEDEKPQRLLSGGKAQKPGSDVVRVSAHAVSDQHIDAETWTGIWRDTCSHQGEVFLLEGRGLISVTMPDLILQDLKQSDFVDASCVLD